MGENSIIKQFVTFVVEDVEFGLPIEEVLEVIFVPKITKTEKTETYMLGIVNLRGKIIPIIDFKILLGKNSVEIKKKSRIIIIKMKGETIGLLVDSVNKVLRTEQSSLELPTEELKKLKLNYIDALYKSKDIIVLLLSSDNLFVLQNS